MVKERTREIDSIPSVAISGFVLRDKSRLLSEFIEIWASYRVPNGTARSYL